MQKFIDINSDMGEGFGVYKVADDEELLKVVSSANIACGFHAGDPRIMAATVKKASQNGVGIGAHPSFPDLNGFGRRDFDLTPLEVKTDVLYQLGALSAFTKSENNEIQHISPHGRLGNLSVSNRSYAEAITEAVMLFDPSIIIMTEPGELESVAREKGLKVAVQMFADRAYNEDHTLVTRKNPNAVIHDSDVVIERCLRMVIDQKVEAHTGKDIDINGHTLCVHGDTEGAVILARKIRQALIAEGVEVKKISDWL